jgi:carnitine-CoA ligase
VQFEDHQPSTFGVMDASANRIANALAGLGIGHGDRVLVMLPNGVEFLQAWFGINRLGAVLVPINIAYNGAFLGHVINNSAARVILIADEHVSCLQAIEAQVSWLQIAIIVDTATLETPPPRLSRLRTLPFDSLLQYPATPVPVTVSYHDVGAIMYTSGTTGPSKRVLM